MKRIMPAMLLVVAGLTFPADISGHLIETRWNQAAPYNKVCPVDRNGETTPPGCGAVAVGQVLYHHRAPVKGFGSVDYDYKTIFAPGDTVVSNVKWNFEEHPFDFANILDSYKKGTYNDTQATAVSEYLFGIGAAMYMQYRKSGSSPKNDGSQLWGLHHNLHVSPDAMYHYRDYYSTEEWTAMLDSELSKGNPVYYGAGWYHYNTNGKLVRAGHFFIIDGKNDDGTYRINWGNNNNGDAVDLEIMNQNGNLPHIGGGAVCYHTRQCMITGLVPAAEGAVWPEQALISTRPLILNDDKALEEVTLGKDRKFTIQYRVQHYSDRTYKNIHDGIGLFRDGESEPFTIIRNDSWRSGLGAGNYLDRRRVVTLDPSLPEGTYTARLMSENAVTGNWQLMLEGVRSSFDITVAADKSVTVRVPHNHGGPSSLFLREPMQEVANPYGTSNPGKVISMKIANTGLNNYEDSLRVTIRPEGAAKPVVLPYYVSVYQGCDLNLEYLIPSGMVDLEGRGYEIAVEYRDDYRGEYRTLGVGEESGIDATPATPVTTDTTLKLYGLDGRMVYRGPADAKPSLRPGIYIERAGEAVRKIIVR